MCYTESEPHAGPPCAAPQPGVFRIRTNYFSPTGNDWAAITGFFHGLTLLARVKDNYGDVCELVIITMAQYLRSKSKEGFYKPSVPLDIFQCVPLQAGIINESGSSIKE